jgi:hypothetical protein
MPTCPNCDKSYAVHIQGRNKTGMRYVRIICPKCDYNKVFEDKENKSTGKSCFVATAVYGCPNHPKVIKLRSFRDETLANNLFGTIFIYLYYNLFGPTFAAQMKKHNKYSFIARRFLDLLVTRLD